MKRKDFILISALIMAGAPLTSKAQLSKSALDYMLQRPQVTKSYENKKFMDHLFMDFGFGGNLMGRHNVKLGPIAEMGLGDWISPEHGVRLNFYGGAYKIGGKETKYASVGLDDLVTCGRCRWASTICSTSPPSPSPARTTASSPSRCTALPVSTCRIRVRTSTTTTASALTWVCADSMLSRPSPTSMQRHVWA